MTYYQIFATGLRVFALWLGLTAISYMFPVPLALGMHWTDADTIALYATSGPILAVSIVVWLYPQAVARKLVPRTRYDDHLKLNLHEVARACAALIGLWLFTRAMPHVLWYVSVFWFSNANTSAFSQLEVAQKTNFIIAWFELLFALALMVRSADFARLLVPKVKA